MTYFNFRLPLTVGLLLLCAAFYTPETFGQNTSADSLHTVQQGETLFSISRQYNLTVTNLRSWNQLESDALSQGQTLRIHPPGGEGRVTHTVSAQESLFGISRMYNVTIAEIQQWNNLSGTNLDTGQELIIYPQDSPTRESIPESAEEQTTGTQTAPPQTEELRSIVDRTAEPSDSRGENTYYTVKSGDSLFGIAREHNMTINELRRLNGIEGDALRVGQRLAVRDVRSAPSVAETAENSTPQGKFVLYSVQSGETVQELLEKFQMSEAELTALNPGLGLNSLSSGQRITVLLPPSRIFSNPYRSGANLEDLGRVDVSVYKENDIANPTTSGELYNPEQLTAAHPNMALGNVVYIENPSNGNGIFVKLNDRHSGSGLKLSHKAYQMLGFSSVERAQVTLYLNN